MNTKDITKLKKIVKDVEFNDKPNKRKRFNKKDFIEAAKKVRENFSDEDILQVQPAF